MSILFMIFSAAIAIGVTIFVHEGGHYVASRAFGVRVTEFMLGLPGPHIGFTKGGTKFGITCIPLGGYARVCGMENEEIHPQTKSVISYVYEKGSACSREVSQHLQISQDTADAILEQLSEWGTVVKVSKRKEEELWETPAFTPTRKEKKLQAINNNEQALVSYKQGQPRNIDNIDVFFENELACQYRSLPFWKRSVILLAGIAVNLLFTVFVLILVFSVIGLAYVNKETGEPTRLILPFWDSVSVGFNVIITTFVAILGLFNPATAPEVVSQSSSIIGIAVMSADFFARGLADALFFMAVISVSVGLMNLLPIPPLDGGKFAIEIIQKCVGHPLSTRTLNAVSLVGIAAFLAFFVFMVNQDVHRFILGS